MATPPSLKDHWSDGAPAYAAFSRKGGLLPLHEELVKLVATEDTRQRPLNVLDIACGDGEPACSIARKLPLSQVTATDFAPGMVKLAEERAKGLALTNIRFSVADAMDLSEFSRDTFDLLTCVAALFMVPDINKALQEFRRVLKPGGLLLFTTWGKPEDTNIANALKVAKERLAPSQPPPRAAVLDPSKLSSREGLSEIVGTVGFTDVNIKDFNLIFDFPKDTLAYPDGGMMKHPMMTMVAAQLAAVGVANPLEALTREAFKVFAEQGYSHNSSFIFPRNIAIIVTAKA